MSKAWTLERNAFLRKNWGKHTAQEIANALGLTKNAVIGRAWRMKLGRVDSKARKTKLESLKQQDFEDLPLKIGGRSLSELEDDDCRYPMQKGLFCAKLVWKDSYCKRHWPLVYKKGKK